MPAGVISLLGIYYLLSVSGAWYFGGDAGHYVTLTKSLATFRGFKDIHIIDGGPHTLYGFGLPLLLVPVYWLFGSNITALNVMVALTTSGFIAGLYLLFRKELNPYLLLIFLIAVGTNYWVVQFSSVIMTEAPFYLFMVFTFWAVERYAKDAHVNTKSLLLVILLAYLTYQTRAIGLVIFPAITLYYFLTKDYKKAGIVTFALSILFIAWNIRTGVPGYITALFDVVSTESGVEIGAHEEGMGFIGNVFWKPVRNTALAFKYLIPMVFSFEYRQELPWNEIRWYPVQILVMIIAYTGFSLHVIRRRLSFDFTIFFMFIGISLYGGVLFTERWWVPLVPFIIFYLIYGWESISGYIIAWRKKAIIQPIMKLALVGVLGFVISLGLKNSDIFIQKTHSSRYDTPAGKAYVEAALWVRDNTPPDARVASRLDKEFFIISGRVGNNAKVWTRNDFNYSDEMRDVVLKGITNLILDFEFDYWILDFLRTDSRITIQVLQNNPEAFNAMFEIVYVYPPPAQNQNPLAYVLKVKEDWYELEKEKRGK